MLKEIKRYLYHFVERAPCGTEVCEDWQCDELNDKFTLPRVMSRKRKRKYIGIYRLFADGHCDVIKEETKWRKQNELLTHSA